MVLRLASVGLVALLGLVTVLRAAIELVFCDPPNLVISCVCQRVARDHGVDAGEPRGFLARAQVGPGVPLATRGLCSSTQLDLLIS